MTNILTKNYSSRNGQRVRLIVIHTTEGIRKNSDLEAFFARSNNASSHVAIDNNGILQMLPYNVASWTLRSGNAVSENAEICGFAKTTRDEWFKNYRGSLDNAAKWIAERCKANGIPIVKLSPADVRAGKAGVIGHHDWTVGMKDGSHWDPGPNFPWDYVINKARELSLSEGGEGDVSYDDAYRAFRDILNEEYENPANPNKKTNLKAQILWSDWKTDHTINTIVAELKGQVAALTNVVNQLVEGNEIDLAAVKQAAEDGTKEALKESITVTGTATFQSKE